MVPIPLIAAKAGTNAVQGYERGDLVEAEYCQAGMRRVLTFAGISGWDCFN
jgi:hypothetical protein